ncbi:hypothetical protein NIES4103_24900 [Nostoc sp. NIES-4103]|nr:hypothetical protein NIES4103_24900 [Nostoc sp. NIES-4103]
MADSWRKIGNGGKSFVINSLNQVFKLNESEQVSLFNAKSNSWEQLGDTKTSKIACNGGRVYRIGEYWHINFRNGNTYYHWQPWEPVYGASEVNDCVDIFPCGSSILYATLGDGNIYKHNDYPGSWELIGTPGKKFVCDGYHLYGLTPDSSAIFRYDGKPKSWTKISDAATDIIARGGLLCKIQPDTGDIFKFDGQPNAWTKIGNPGKMFAIDDQGNLYGLTPNKDSVWQFNNKSKSWIKIGGAAGRIFAGGTSLCATSPDEKEVWMFQIKEENIEFETGLKI